MKYILLLLFLAMLTACRLGIADATEIGWFNTRQEHPSKNLPSPYQLLPW